MTPGVPTLHPRVRLLPDAFLPTLLRAINRGLWGGTACGTAAGAALLVAIAPIEAVDPLVAIIVVALVSAGSGLIIWMASIPRAIRAPFEAFSWLGSAEARRFREGTGSSVPGTAADMRAWLDRHPGTPATALARVEILAALGDVLAARAELAAATPSRDDIERVYRATLTIWLGFLETGEADFAPMDAIEATLSPNSRAALEAVVARASAESRVRLLHERPEPLAPLAESRRRLGPEATGVLLRRGLRRIGPPLLLVGAGLGLVEAGAAILIGLA
jgi:hypothetical protein